MRLALVPARRPADVLTEIGWQGSTNYYGDMAPFSAVLRSWDDRFGAVPVLLGDDTLIVMLQGIPARGRETDRLAFEVNTLCPDVADSGEDSNFASDLNTYGGFQCWWD